MQHRDKLICFFYMLTRDGSDAWGAIRNLIRDVNRSRGPDTFTSSGALALAVELADELLSGTRPTPATIASLAACTDEPAPVPNDGPAIWDLVIADLESYLETGVQLDQPVENETAVRQLIADARARDQVGRERYGTPLHAHNGRRPLVDAYQEALDLVVYLRQSMAEAGSAEQHEPLVKLYSRSIKLALDVLAASTD